MKRNQRVTRRLREHTPSQSYPRLSNSTYGATGFPIGFRGFVSPNIVEGYGYQPSWWDEIIGADWGTDPCTRSGVDANLCFSKYMKRVQTNIGWPPELIDMLITNASRIPAAYQMYTGDASTYWSTLTKEMPKWLKDNHYRPRDLPKFDKVFTILQNYSDNSFDYEKFRESVTPSAVAKSVFVDTTKDLGGLIKEFWKELPKEARIALIIGGAIYLVAQTAPLISLIALKD